MSIYTACSYYSNNADTAGHRTAVLDTRGRYLRQAVQVEGEQVPGEEELVQVALLEVGSPVDLQLPGIVQVGVPVWLGAVEEVLLEVQQRDTVVQVPLAFYPSFLGGEQ